MSVDLETISAEDLAAALHPDPDGGTKELGELGDLILEEVKARLNDPVRRSELPGTTLMQLARDQVRFQEAQAARRVEAVEEPPPLSEIIAGAGLPSTRKLELVRAEILRVTDELDRLNAMRDELEDE